MTCTHCNKEVLGYFHSVVEDVGDMHMPCFLQWLRDNELTIDEEAMDFFRDFGSIFLTALTIAGVTIIFAMWTSDSWQISSNP